MKEARKMKEGWMEGEGSKEGWVEDEGSKENEGRMDRR
jgi:hypothetical protein